MPFYIFKAVSHDGELKKGSGQFDNLESLDRFLATRQEWLSHVITLPDIVGWLLRHASAKVKPMEIAEFCNNMALYLGGGISIHAALTDMADTAKLPAYKKALQQIQTQLNDGQLFSVALDQTGIFPDVVVHMARIGEESGILDRMMSDAGLHIERIEEIKSATKRAMIYPCFTLFAITGAMIFWIAFVLPQLIELFMNMGVDLPPATRALIFISGFLTKNWLVLIISFVSIPIGFILGREIPKVRFITDRILWNMPIAGTIIQGSQTAFYFQYLSLMIRAGVLIANALKTTAGSLTNTYLMSKVEGITDSIRGGVSLYDSFRATEVIELMACRMVGIGEQTGNLEDQMEKLAEIYFAKVKALVDIIGKTLEPLILGLAGAIFIFFIIAMLGPLYGMLGNLSM